MTITGILGLHGAVQDHLPHLENLGTEVLIVKGRESLDRVDRLIIPGGESTVMAMYLDRFGFGEQLKSRVRAGMPVWGICAGCILLAEEIDGTAGPLGLLPVSVERNAYGRQIASDMMPLEVTELGLRDFPAVYIRAPRIIQLDERVQVLARRDGDPVFVRHGSILATTFHPELTALDDFHRHFLAIPTVSSVAVS